ncbi:MAG: hypothetical protein QN229_00340 [Desulfurococcaceae archaeon TW002]
MARHQPKTVLFILTSWLLTLPVTSGLSIVIYYVLTYVMGVRA